MRLPGEEKLKAAIRRDYALDFHVASDLLNLGLRIFQHPEAPKPNGEMDNVETWVSLGIVAKALRQYRAIGALADAALGDIAEANSRMLVETMFAAVFLMRPTVILKKNGKPVPEVPGYPLTTAFRTRLYLAHDFASTLKTVKAMVEHGQIDPTDADACLAIAESQAKKSAGEIGPEWARRQKDGRSFSGVSVFDLADSFEMSFVYNYFYRPASARVHGTDARGHIHCAERGDGGIVFSASSSDKGVAESLAFASLLVLQIIVVTNQRFGFGFDEELSKLAPRVQEMTTREVKRRVARV
ncbi:MAG: hypothetical protein K1X57_18310 [Gemmataceae bacterium]|nr:hypothetical protein [Gemmataceae bacterium]